MFSKLISYLPLGCHFIICCIGCYILWKSLTDDDDDDDDDNKQWSETKKSLHVEEKEEEENIKAQSEEEKEENIKAQSEEEKEENIKAQSEEEKRGRRENIRAQSEKEESEDELFLDKRLAQSECIPLSHQKEEIKNGIDNAILTDYINNTIYFREKQKGRIITGIFEIDEEDIKYIDTKLYMNTRIKDFFKNKEIYEKFIKNREYNGIDTRSTLFHSYPNYFLQMRNSKYEDIKQKDK